MWPALPALIGAIGSGLGTLIGSKQQEENVDKTIAANKELAQYQYSKDLEMWNRGNVYNDPSSQMERLKKAGLNPNMVYGSGSAAGMAAGQLPKYNAPTVDYNYTPPVDIPSMISQFQNFRLNSAQIRNTDAAANAAEATNKVMDSGLEQTSETGDFRKGTLRGFLAADKQALLQQQYQQKGQLFGSQKGYQEGRLRTQSLEQQRLVEQTRNLDLQNDYFAAKAITGLFGGAVGSLGKVGALWKSRKGLGEGTLKNFKANPSTRHQWRGRYGDTFGWGND